MQVLWGIACMRHGFSKDVGEVLLDVSLYAPESGVGTLKWITIMRKPLRLRKTSIDGEESAMGVGQSARKPLL